MTAARRIISNAGPLMALAKLNRLDLLAKLYQQVEAPVAVYREVVTEDPNARVLIDDDVARREARRLSIEVKGTLGVLVQAFRRKLLSLDETELLIQQIAARPDIWIGARLCEGVLNGLVEQ